MWLSTLLPVWELVELVLMQLTLSGAYDVCNSGRAVKLWWFC